MKGRDPRASDRRSLRVVPGAVSSSEAPGTVTDPDGALTFQPRGQNVFPLLHTG